LCNTGIGDSVLGRIKDKTKIYEDLSPEDLHVHVRKNISIPKYMDAFLYEHKISLSKLVQSTIKDRMAEVQAKSIEKDVKNFQKKQTLKKRLLEEQKKNPQFNHELQRAKQLLTEYFTAFDSSDTQITERQKQIMLKDFPELYVDVLKFEQWEKKNKQRYLTIRPQYDNVVERLIKIKQEFL
jgi:hypothetical protein